MTSASDELELPAGHTRSVVDSQEKPGSELATTWGPLLAPFVARASVAALLGGYSLVALLFVIDANAGFPKIMLAAGLLTVLLSLQLFYFTRPETNLHSPTSYMALAAQVLLIYPPLLLIYGQSWTGLPAMLAGGVLLVFRPVAAWTAYAAILAGVAWTQYRLTHSLHDAVYLTEAIAVAGFEVYGLVRLGALIAELHAARTELANSAVSHERLRFARDLHDLLGLSLSAIAPKGEVAHRLVKSNPDRAKQELAEILDISRRALADVRAVAHGYRELNLDEESRTAESVLASSRVEVRMDVTNAELPVHIRTVLAAVLREGVANVLEHSDAERCHIVMRQAGDRVLLDIVNDGVDESSTSPYEGSGLTVLAERVAGLGGELTAGRDSDGRFRLHLTVPAAKEGPDGAHAEPQDEQIPRQAVRLTGVFVTVVFCGIFLQGLLYRLYVEQTAAALVLSTGYMLLLLAIQLFYMSRPTTQLRSPTSYAMLVVQACLVYLPWLQFGQPLLAIPGFFAGSALLVLPPALGWTVFLGVVATAGWAQGDVAGSSFLQIAYAAIGAAIVSLVVYGLTWLIRTMAQLRTARIQLAQAAVADERLRFARDLHDLLGLSLSAITLKSELAHRLVTAAPERARDELTEILGISRLALADVRLVASGYRDLSLSEEFQTAESLLVAADVDVRMDVNYGELPAQVGTLLATVLREGVTNVLRHSKGERCEITVQHEERQVSLEIVNDGVTEDMAKRTNGSGIHNLSYRVALLGGELTAGLEPDGRFRLRAKVPA
jgi:signal transduction histidine kinase